MNPTRLALILSLAIFCIAAKPVTPIDPLPSSRQLAWHEDDLTMFIHFGMNTFTNLGTGKGDEDEKLFNPTELDCKQWVAVAKEAGFKGMILTAKHHDGFCLWPSSTTEHSVQKSGWKDGKGDVVREFTDACKEAGMKAGIYCSPYDLNVKFYLSDKPRYATMYRQQLTELLSNYGPVYEMWFDGNKANVADWPNVIDVVRKLQPNAIIKQGPVVKPITEDLRWVGNEQACALIANWCVYPPPEQADDNGQRLWFPVECDTMMNGHWFWSPDAPPKDLPTLLNFYYTSVGRGSILMLNVAPDKRGKFDELAVARLKEFRAALDSIFSKNLAAGKTATASHTRDEQYAAANVLDGKTDTYWTTEDGAFGGAITIDLGGEQEFNVVRIEEPIELGQRVKAYKIEAFTGGTWKQVQAGATIGRRKLDRFPKVKASQVRVTIIESRAEPIIREIGVHLDNVSPAEYFEPAKANAEIVRRPRATAPAPAAK